MSSLIVITPPAPIVTAEEARSWAPVFAKDDDTLIEGLLAAAQAYIEPPLSGIGRAFGRQTLEWRLDAWPVCTPSDRIELPAPPLVEVLGVTYVDSDSVEVDLPTSAYRVVGVGARGAVILLSGQSWPGLRSGPEGASITFEAGYELDDPILFPAKQAVVLGAARMRGLITQDMALRGETLEGAGSRQWGVSEWTNSVVTDQINVLLTGYRTIFVA